MIGLITKYGTITSIPETELLTHGLERVKREGGFILRRIDDPGAGAVGTLQLHHIGKMYGINTEQIPDHVSMAYLKRMQIAINAIQESDEDGYYLSLWTQYVRCWAQKQGLLGSLIRTQDSAKAIFAELKLDWATWVSGIGCWHVDLESRTVQDPDTQLRSHLPEFRKALTQFIANEILRPDACLQNIAAKIGIKDARLSAVIQAVESRPEFLKIAVRIAHERGIRKGARRDQDSEGFFHLNRIRKALSDKKKVTEGIFSVGLASKNPFTILDIGNDSGCCIGIYINGESNEFGGGMGDKTMPVIAIDPFIQMVEIKHGKDRIGSAMLFLATDGDGQILVAINSIELKTKFEPVADRLSDAVIEWVTTYAEKVGAAYAAMGMHDYNTGCFHLNFKRRSIQPITAMAFRGIEREVHTDIEVTEEIENAHFSQKKWEKNQWMVLGNLVKLPSITYLNKYVDIVFTPQDLRSYGIAFRDFALGTSRAKDVFSTLQRELNLSGSQVIPGFIAPWLDYDFLGCVLTLPDIREQGPLEESYEDGTCATMIVVPVPFNWTKNKKINDERPLFSLLATMLLLKEQMGSTRPCDYGFHRVQKFDKDANKCIQCYLEFDVERCILHLEKPDGVELQEWLCLEIS